MQEQFPARGRSGYVALLTVTLRHGKGEAVLPGGFRLKRDDPALKAIETAGFVLPESEGAVRARLDVAEEGDSATTRLTIPFVPLPGKAGRHELTLPPVPIALARASGEVATLCTAAHTIVVEDPTSNLPDAQPMPNPAPRRQLEVWRGLQQALLIAAAALLVGALLAWLIGKWLRRPRTAPPPPPARPPWEVALEELFDIRNADLVRDQRHAVHYERVANTIRKYLGDRYGFDGLECTTRETLLLLREAPQAAPMLDAIAPFLRHADLVKFAQLTPTTDECVQALERGESIVRNSIPSPEELSANHAPEQTEDGERAPSGGAA
jgi:hypothetical protein